jgi:hypothetical protein
MRSANNRIMMSGVQHDTTPHPMWCREEISAGDATIHLGPDRITTCAGGDAGHVRVERRDGSGAIVRVEAGGEFTPSEAVQLSRAIRDAAAEAFQDRS